MSERHNPYLRKYLARITLYSNTIQRNTRGSHTHTNRKEKKGFFLCPKAFNKQNLKIESEEVSLDGIGMAMRN